MIAYPGRQVPGALRERGWRPGRPEAIASDLVLEPGIVVTVLVGRRPTAAEQG